MKNIQEMLSRSFKAIADSPERESLMASMGFFKPNPEEVPDRYELQEGIDLVAAVDFTNREPGKSWIWISDA